MWEQYQRASAPAPLPIALGRRPGEGARAVPVRIGDDIPSALRAGKLRDVVLRIQTSGAAKGDALAVTLGDAPAKVAENSGDNQHELPLDPRAVKQGVNQLKLTIARRDASAKKPMAIEHVNVDVRYQRT